MRAQDYHPTYELRPAPVHPQSVMYASHFDGGNGYVVHKIKYRQGVCSAWFTNDGTIIDAEYHDRARRSRSIRPNSPAWRHCEKQGRAFSRG